jgi:hypothetical protein
MRLLAKSMLRIGWGDRRDGLNLDHILNLGSFNSSLFSL